MRQWAVTQIYLQALVRLLLTAWFSFKTPYVRLHVRPPVLEDNKKDLADYVTTKAIISFPVDRAIPKALVKKLVKASIKVMKQKQAPA